MCMEKGEVQGWRGGKGVQVARRRAKEKKRVQIMEIPVCNQEPDSPQLP